MEKHDEANKISEIDFVRGFAIIGVLLIHGTAQPVMEIPLGSRSQIIYIVLNKLGNFSVPAFIFISGIVLFYRYGHLPGKTDMQSFFMKRVKFIVIPYILFSCLYYLINSWENGLHASFSQFIYQLLTGRANYHLYFVILMIQYYLLFPVLLAFYKKYGNKGGATIVLFSVLTEIIIGVLIETYDWATDKSILFTTYLTFFSIGGLIGYNYNKVMEKCSRQHLLWLLPLTAIFLFLHIIVSELALLGIWYNEFVKELIVQLYSLFAGISLLVIGKILCNFNNRVIKMIRFLGIASFGIYLIHPLFQSLIKLNIPVGTAFYHLHIFGKLLLLYVGSATLVWILRKIRISWLFLGKN